RPGVEDVVLDGDPGAVVLQLDLTAGALIGGVVDHDHVLRVASARVVTSHEDVALVAARDEIVAHGDIAGRFAEVLARDLDADVAVVDLVALDDDVAAAVHVDAVGGSIPEVRGVCGGADVVDHVLHADAIAGLVLASGPRALKSD